MGASPWSAGVRRLVASHFGQATDAVALEATVQRSARQMRDRRLQRVEAVVQRQARVATEGDDDRRLINGQHLRVRILRTGRQILERRALLPFRDGL